MTHHATADFRAAYHQLPDGIQKAADAAYAVLKSNPRHPSLHFKRSVSFGRSVLACTTAAVAVESGNDLVWFWIGSHGDYDKLLGKA